MESEFAAKLPPSHHKLILYDIALWNDVTGGQHSQLTDHHRFTRLYSAIILPDGVESYQLSKNQMHTKVAVNLKFATSPTLGHAKIQMLIANTATSAKSVTNPDILRKTVHPDQDEIYGLQPRYLCHNLWKDPPSLSLTMAEWSETAQPLPCPPFNEISNPITIKTITDNPALFQVKTPIQIDVFKSFLKHHPNPDFVNSVCDGLHEGFWPWADTLHESFPTTHDKS